MSRVSTILPVLISYGRFGVYGIRVLFPDILSPRIPSRVGGLSSPAFNRASMFMIKWQ